MRPLKIAIIVNPLIPVPPLNYGGIERIVSMLIQEFKQLGHNVTLFANPDSNANCKLVPYSGSSEFTFKEFIKVNLLTSKILFQHFDVVHTFGRMSNIAALMFFKIPKIVSYQLPPTPSQLKKALKLDIHKSVYFTGCSDYISNQIRPYSWSETIYNGVNVVNYSFNKEVSAQAPLIFLGRIQYEKGPHIAIEVAMKSSRNLIIAGNIPEEKLHQDYFLSAVKPFIDGIKIRYVGTVNDTEKNELLRNSAALLMPITWNEPFGIVMAESLACGTPVIGFNRGAVPEVIEHGVNGFLCADVAEMSAAVCEISKINRMTCRRIVEDKFSATPLAQQYLGLYRKALG